MRFSPLLSSPQRQNNIERSGSRQPKGASRIAKALSLYIKGKTELEIQAILNANMCSISVAKIEKCWISDITSAVDLFNDLPS